jgi:hypothetical protein
LEIPNQKEQELELPFCYYKSDGQTGALAGQDKNAGGETNCFRTWQIKWTIVLGFENNPNKLIGVEFGAIMK